MHRCKNISFANLKLLSAEARRCKLFCRGIIMNTCDFAEGRVLSIQSHVVSGYVGNKSATFPLQILGFEVDAINSVQFSNHTGYAYFKGQVLDSTQLEQLMTGLRFNNILNYTHLLTGYIGNESFVRKIADVAKELKEINPGVIYVCDPVMGDNGQMYVPPEILPIYQNEILPIANIITPNQFEAEILTGITIKTEEDAWEAVEKIHSQGPETVIITSTNLGPEDKLMGLASNSKGLSFLLHQLKCMSKVEFIHLDGKKLRVRLNIPKLACSFTGTGDLFTACFLAWMFKTNGDIKIASEKTVSTVQDVLKRTFKAAENKPLESDLAWVAATELKLIQSKNDIENPKTPFEAQIV
uniref:Pyridoxal kinase n=1 Tax=Strigamia maritima TaxID=126957 RepID=T1JPG7_STRMM